jgi:hypothetical protein
MFYVFLSGRGLTGAMDRMKSIREDKQIKLREAVQSAYRLGVLNERDRAQRRMNCLFKANYRLWEELTRLDDQEPLIGIILSVDVLKHIIKYLKKKKMYWYAKKLQKMFDEHPAIKLEALYKTYKKMIDETEDRGQRTEDRKRKKADKKLNAER